MQTPELLNAWTLTTRSLRALRGTWFNTLCLGLLAWILPIAVWVTWLVKVGESYGEGVVALSFLGILLYEAAVTPVAAGAIGYGAFQFARGHKIPLRDLLREALPRMLPLVWTGFVVYFLSFLGCLFCIFLGAFVYALMFLAIPVAMVERASMPTALRRSWELTEGYRLSLGSFALLPWLLNYGLVVFSVALQDVNQGDVLAGILGISLMPLFFLTVILISLAGGVAYHDLRHLREGEMGVDLLEVFE